MPTDRPKIQVYLEPETFQAVAEFADALGITRSSAVRQLLDNAVPMFHAVADAARAVQGASEAQRQAFGAVADQLSAKQDQGRELMADVYSIFERVGRQDSPPLSGESDS